MQKQRQQITQGARIVLRDAEWLVKRADLLANNINGQKLTVIGLSEIVRDKEKIFFTDYENDVRVLNPADTKLIPDDSDRYMKTRLFIESMIRQSTPSGSSVTIGDNCAADTWPYQLAPTTMALAKPRQRILIADGVGLGKTVEAGILVSELIRREKGRRILVVTVKSMLTQFQKEFWGRFSIPLTRLDSLGIQRIKTKIPANQNPFHYYDKAIISIDTLKQDTQYRSHLEEAYWDIIIVDEAHNVAERGGSRSQRANLAKLLSLRSDTLIMLSATPHDGRAKSFASLMKMLDPMAIPCDEHFTASDIDGLFIRRLKKDLPNHIFKQKETETAKACASENEEIFFRALTETKFATLNETRSDSFLFKTLLKKGVFSSPDACAEIIKNRIKKLSKSENSLAKQDIDALETLLRLLEKITIKDFSKYQKLLAILKNQGSRNYWNGTDTKDRLVIFTESIPTLKFLAEQLPRDLGLQKDQVLIMHGSLSDIEQQKIVEDFGNASHASRLLITTDVASEGINLHFLCHRLIHFDLPWSVMTLQQRCGRIDRYGQEETPLITYLITQSGNPEIMGDFRILEILKEKDEQIHKNIGDPLSLENVFKEDDTREAIESHLDPEFFSQEREQILQEEESLFADLFNHDSTAAESNTATPMPSLYPSDFAYFKEALEYMQQFSCVQCKINEQNQSVVLEMPEVLKNRYRYFPNEIETKDNKIHLTADKKTMMHALAECRSKEGAWPEIQYLWALHPAVNWVRDSIYARFGRLEAPVMTVPRFFPPNEGIFIMSGLIPNKKGHPVIQEILCVPFKQGNVMDDVQTMAEFLSSTDFGRGEYANRKDPFTVEALEMLLIPALEIGKKWMLRQRELLEQEMLPELNRQLEALENLKNRHLKEIQLQFDFASKGIASIQKKKKEKALQDIQNHFKAQMKWIEETIKTDKHPHFQIIGVIQGGKDADRPDRHRK